MLKEKKAKKKQLTSLGNIISERSKKIHLFPDAINEKKRLASVPWQNAHPKKRIIPKDESKCTMKLFLHVVEKNNSLDDYY